MLKIGKQDSSPTFAVLMDLEYEKGLLEGNKKE